VNRKALDLPWVRRAQPLLGTLVEIGLRAPKADAQAMFDAAFTRIREIQDCLSRFAPNSDVSRFNALRCGESLTIQPCTQSVLIAARTLQLATAGAFDVSLCTSPQGWNCIGNELHKLDDSVRLDLGGIAKGYAVDCTVQTLLEQGCVGGWVNAGGDLRSFGEADVPICLRDESTGGVRSFASLRDGAFATSHFARGSRSRLVRRAEMSDIAIHASVAAPLCMWADALTKIVACSGDTSHPLLARHDAVAWIH
jgi:thiamine biosynthesis lipoprotein